MGTPIFVLDQQGTPLMPTRRHNKVWYWLRKGLARLVSREPFTVQLCFETTGYTQEVSVGVDTGSRTVGVAATTNGEAVLQADVHLRTDIHAKMLQRRQYRRTRRSRKTRYRPARWANRRRPSGWLPPSIRSKCAATVKAVCCVASLLPVHRITIEVAGFDTQKLQDPDISGLSYQQGTLSGYHLREYLLMKWQRRCAYCGVEGVPLQIEHIVPRTRGGSDRASNLTLACAPCNSQKGTQTAAEFGHPHVQAHASKPLRDAAHVSSLKTGVVEQLRQRFGPSRVAVTYGYETKYKRIQVLDLPKSHTNDAIAIACELGETVRPCEVMSVLRCIGRGNYQRFNGAHSEHACWAPRKVRGFRLYERVEAKGKRGYIGGRRAKGAFVIKDVVNGQKVLEVSPSKLRRQARPTWGWILLQQPVLQKSRKEGGASSSR